MSIQEDLAGDLSPIWNTCLEVLESTVDAPVRNSLQGSRPLRLEGQCLKVGVQGSFSRDFLAKPNHRERVCSVLRQVSGHDLHVDFLTLKSPRHEVPEESLATPAVGGADLEPAYDPSLNPRYTFESYVRGNNNNMAAAAARAVAEKPAAAYNPLFLYGGVGLGKTHLMHAIGHAVLQKRRKARVVYMSAERFTNEMIDSISEAQMARFRRKYRNDVDVLLVDDIQFLANKERTQEEFFHTFNELHGANKQIVISSDRPPKQIPTLEDRLRSRFEWGMIADIQPPDLETRVAILRKKADQCQISIPNDVTSLLAEKIPSNIRELEGALTRVIAYSSLQGQPVNMTLATEALQGILSDSPLQVLDIKSIQEIVAEYFGIPLSDLTGKRRDRKIVQPRQVAMYLCKELTGASYPEIGSQFGGKDHTTVMHAFRKVEENLEDHFYKTSLENIQQRLKELSR